MTEYIQVVKSKFDSQSFCSFFLCVRVCMWHAPMYTCMFVSIVQMLGH